MCHSHSTRDQCYWKNNNLNTWLKTRGNHFQCCDVFPFQGQNCNEMYVEQFSKTEHPVASSLQITSISELAWYLQDCTAGLFSEGVLFLTCKAFQEEILIVMVWAVFLEILACLWFVLSVGMLRLDRLTNSPDSRWSCWSLPLASAAPPWASAAGSADATINLNIIKWHH